MNINKRTFVAIFFSAISLIGCNGGAIGQSNSGSTSNNTDRSNTSTSSGFYYNCSGNISDVCNNGKDVILKNGTSGNRQGLKLIAPALGSGITKLAIQDSDGQIQNDVVFYPSKSSTMNCDFSNTSQCSITVDATNGIAGKNVAIVALDSNNNKIASIGITVKSGDGVTPTPSPTPPSANDWGNFTVTQDTNLAKMTQGQTSSFTITLENSEVGNNNVSIPLSFDSASNGNLVTLNKNSCDFTSTNKICTVNVTANGGSIYGSNTLEFNHRNAIIGADGRNYGTMEVMTIAVPDPNAINDSLKTPKMVSNAYSEYNTTGNIASFMVRGPKLDTVYSLKGQFIKTLLDNIKQSDPVAYEKDFGANAKVDAQGNINVNFEEIQLSSSSDSNPSVFSKGNSEVVNYDGKKIKITVTNVILDKDPQSNIPATKKIIDDIYNEAKHNTTPTIYYAHCTQGMDRTGYFITWYLVHTYQNSDKTLNDVQQYNNVVKLGLVRWSNGSDFTDLNFNTKSWQGSNKVAQIPADMKTQEGFHTGDSFWSSYPTDQSQVSSSFGVVPNALEYAYTLPLCGSYTDNCLSVSGNKVLITADLSGFDSIYVAYADAAGKTIKIAGPFNKDNIILDKPSGTAMTKVYAVNSNLGNSFIKEKVAAIK